MAEFIKPYNDDPFVGNLSTPVNSSNFTKLFLGNDKSINDLNPILHIEKR